MTIPTFVPALSPSPGLINKPEIKILKADFGDGYTQATPDGMNNVRKVYDLRWDVLMPDEADAIVSFFGQQAGAAPFLYRMPGAASPGKWTCEAWTDTVISGGYRSIAATLRQSFNLDT